MHKEISSMYTICHMDLCNSFGCEIKIVFKTNMDIAESLKMEYSDITIVTLLACIPCIDRRGACKNDCSAV